MEIRENKTEISDYVRSWIICFRAIRRSEMRSVVLKGGVLVFVHNIDERCFANHTCINSRLSYFLFCSVMIRSDESVYFYSKFL